MQELVLRVRLADPELFNSTLEEYSWRVAFGQMTTEEVFANMEALALGMMIIEG